MDQAKVVINLNEGVIQLEGPVEFVQRYLEQYAPALKGLPSAEPKAKTTKPTEARVRRRGGQRSCTRAIRAEIKAGFLQEAKASGAIRERLVAKGVACSSGLLRASLKKAVEEGRLVTTGRGRGLVYCQKAAGGGPAQPAESSAEAAQASEAPA